MKQLSSPLNTCIISPKKSSTPSMHSSNENDHHLISHDSSSHPSILILKKRYDTKHCLARKLILARRTQGRRQIYLLFSQFHSISFTSSNARKHCIYASLYDNRNHTDKQNISPPPPPYAVNDFPLATDFYLVSNRLANNDLSHVQVCRH